MPYITNAQKEWARWCDLSSAVHQICTADRCDEASAVQQLQLAIADGNVRVSWADKPMQYVDEPIFDSIMPPTDASWWLNHAKIDLYQQVPQEDGPDVEGLVRDDWCLAPWYAGRQNFPAEHCSVLDWIDENRDARIEMVLEHRIRFRPLLVWGPALNELWGRPRPIQSTNSEASSGEKPPQPRRSASEVQIRQVLKKIYADPTNNRPNVNRAWDLLKATLPNARRKPVMDILSEPEFKDQRRGPGNQRKS